MAIIGRKPSSRPSLFLEGLSFFQYAFTDLSVWTTASAGFITHVGGYIERKVATKVVLGLYLPDAVGSPTLLLARTDPITLPPGNPAPSFVEAPITWTNVSWAPGSRQSALRVPPAQKLVPALLITDAGGFYIMCTTIGPVMWRTASNNTGLLTNPFSPIGSQNLYTPAIWAQIQPSTAPTTSLISPASGAQVTEAQPTFIASVSDPDIATYGDALQAYEVEVWQQGATSTLWVQQFVATGAEINSSQITRTYAGPPLTGGNTYIWRIRAQDLTGEWGAFSAFASFVVPLLSVVDTSNLPSPVGKVDGNSAAINWSARWWHTAATAMAQAQVRVLDTNGAVVVTGAKVAKVAAGTNVPPGTPFTVNAAEAGIGALPYGTYFQWQIRGLPAGGNPAIESQWSPWSNPVSFNTNALPSTPVLVSPASNEALSVRPFLVVQSADPDSDDAPLSGVVWDFEVQEVATGVVRSVEASAYDALLGQPRAITDSTIIPVFGEYRWRARGRDLSAGAFGEGPWSDWGTFTYSSGTGVTITNPAVGEAQATTAVRFAWTTSQPQASFQIQIYNQSTNALVYESIRVFDTTQVFDVPATILQPGISYIGYVNVWNAVNVRGQSQGRIFTISFNAVQGLADLTVAVVARPGDVEPTTPLVQWTRTTYPTPQWRSYVVRRYVTAEGEGSAVTIAVVTNIAQLGMYDYHAPPGVSITYKVSQRVFLNGNEVESAAVYFTTAFTLTVPVIASVNDPVTYHFPCVWMNRMPRRKLRPRRKVYDTMGTGGVPTVVRERGGQKTRQIDLTLRSDPWTGMVAKERMRMIENLIEAGHLVSYRDADQRIFMDIADHDIGGGSTAGTFDVSLSLEQVNYTEG